MVSSNMNESDAILADSIRKAFEESLRREATRSTMMSHSDCVRAREYLPLYRLDDLTAILPQVLVDLLATHTGHCVATEHAEDVLFFLAPLDDAFAQKLKANAFENFTPAQIDAVCQWLRRAVDWPDFRLYEDQVDAAIRYWERLAGGERGKGEKGKERGNPGVNS
jgi:hypothetical protein